MKQNTSLSNIFVGIFFIFLYLIQNYPFILVGAGIWSIITGLFKIKNYQNNKLYYAITGMIVIFSLIISYIQLPYSLNSSFYYTLTIFATLAIVISTYGYAHDEDKSLLKNITIIIFLIGLLCLGVGLWNTM